MKFAIFTENTVVDGNKVTKFTACKDGEVIRGIMPGHDAVNTEIVDRIAAHYDGEWDGDLEFSSAPDINASGVPDFINPNGLSFEKLTGLRDDADDAAIYDVVESLVDNYMTHLGCEYIQSQLDSFNTGCRAKYVDVVTEKFRVNVATEVASYLFTLQREAAEARQKKA